jgi:hypothetical protein
VLITPLLLRELGIGSELTRPLNVGVRIVAAFGGAPSSNNDGDTPHIVAKSNELWIKFTRFGAFSIGRDGAS